MYKCMSWEEGTVSSFCSVFSPDCDVTPPVIKLLTFCTQPMASCLHLSTALYGCILTSKLQRSRCGLRLCQPSLELLNCSRALWHGFAVCELALAQARELVWASSSSWWAVCMGLCYVGEGREGENAAIWSQAVLACFPAGQRKSPDQYCL